MISEAQAKIFPKTLQLANAALRQIRLDLKKKKEEEKKGKSWLTVDKKTI